MPNSILSPISFSSWFDETTGDATQVQVYFYGAGSLGDLAVYTDSGLSVAHPQPVTTTGNGRMPPVFIGEDSYRFRVYTMDNVLIEDVDGLPGAEAEPATVPDPIGTDQTALLATGDIIAAFATNAGASSTRTGFVRCNGGTIGNVGSNATERQNADTEDLFTWLWNNSTNTELVIQTSAGAGTTRGANANADWLANKRMPLPDLRGRVIAGLDNMGSNIGAAGRLNSGGMGVDALAPGSAGGAQLHTLTTSQMPVHNHGVTDPTHNHSINQSAHTHGVTDPGHAHNYAGPSDLSSSNFGLQSGSVNFERRIALSTVAGTMNTLTAVAALTNVSIQANSISISNNAVATGVTIQNSGSGAAHHNVQPTMALMYYMRL
jgi:microcystin-dependent protein